MNERMPCAKWAEEDNEEENDGRGEGDYCQDGERRRRRAKKIKAGAERDNDWLGTSWLCTRDSVVTNRTWEDSNISPTNHTVHTVF